MNQVRTWLVLGGICGLLTVVYLVHFQVQMQARLAALEDRIDILELVGRRIEVLTEQTAYLDKQVDALARMLMPVPEPRQKGSGTGWE